MIIALNTVHVLAVCSVPWPGSVCGVRVPGAGRSASPGVCCVSTFGRSAAGVCRSSGADCGGVGPLVAVLVVLWLWLQGCLPWHRGVGAFRGLCWGFGGCWLLVGLGRCAVCFWGAGCLALVVRVSCVGSGCGVGCLVGIWMVFL